MRGYASLRAIPMFGFLKKLVGKSEPAPAPPPVTAPSPAPVAAPPPAQPSGKAVMPQTTSKLTPTPLGTGFPKAPAATPAPVAPPPPMTFSGVTVDIPLKAIWPKLNPAVVQAAQSQPGGKDRLKVPIELVQPMLAKGAVKIPYGQLRKFAPEGMFPSLPDKEALEVELPLSEVLACLKPEQLTRRSQKKIEVPDDIGPVFGAGGANLRVADGKAKAPVPSAAPEPPPAAPPEVKPVEAKAPEPAPAPAPKPAPAPMPTVAPPPPPPPAAAVPPQPAAPEPIRAPKLDPSLATLKPGVPKPPPTPPVSTVPKPPPPPPAAPKLPSVPPPPPAAPKLPSMGAPVTKPAAPAAAPAPVSDSGTFVLPVSEVAPHWAAQGKSELKALDGRTLEIPASILEAALKTGKLAFAWRDARGWVRPAEGALPSLADDFIVELPLPVVAPKFLQQRGLAKPRKKIEVSEEIPDLFAQKAAAPAAAPAAPAAAPLPKAPAPVGVPGAKPMLDYGDIFGQPDKKDWTLAEVTQRAAGLRGVAGAVIATSDGLLVAGTWPTGVKTEAVAAFIPQMHSRMVQCTKELKLGEPGNLTLMIENVPLQIFKTSSNYLAVLGRAGENLPKAQLTALAMRLGQTQPPK